jgi:hypothetical protein
MISQEHIMPLTPTGGGSFDRRRSDFPSAGTASPGGIFEQRIRNEKEQCLTCVNA